MRWEGSVGIVSQASPIGNKYIRETMTVKRINIYYMYVDLVDLASRGPTVENKNVKVGYM